LSRKGQKLPVTTLGSDYSPGDLVTWDLGGNVPHIGIVAGKKSPQSGHYLIVHNIGQGPKVEDVLFQWKITLLLQCSTGFPASLSTSLRLCLSPIKLS
jgi:uncharacterized protein